MHESFWCVQVYESMRDVEYELVFTVLSQSNSSWSSYLDQLKDERLVAVQLLFCVLDMLKTAGSVLVLFLLGFFLNVLLILLLVEIISGLF